MAKNEDSALISALNCKCPRCRKGQMFEYPVYNIAKFSKMYSNCPACQLKYEIEPGFFIGAMYVSYAMSVGIFIVVGFILYNFFGDPETWVYIITVPTVALLLLPLMYRYSRVLYLYWFGSIKYDPNR